MNWYSALIKPPFTPPAWIFAPAWIILYILIFASFIIMLTTKTNERKAGAIFIFIAQLILNLSWSPAFFVLQNPPLAFGIIILLLISIILTIIAFYKISKLSAYLLIPYLLWVIFATYLNFGLMVLN